MLNETIARQGNWLFRWRSYVIFAFLPFLALIVQSPEAVETAFGRQADLTYEAACMLLAFFGLGIRAYTVGYTPKGTSGRNTKRQVAESLNTTGIYSIVRNPLYLGNAIVYMAFALFTESLTTILAMALFLVVYLERIVAAEERFLAQKFGDDYRAWAGRVPAFVPRFALWTPALVPFSLRNVLKREYSGFFGIIAAFLLFHYAREIVAEGDMGVDPGWLALLLGGGAIYVVLRTLKRHTRLLNVEGR